MLVRSAGLGEQIGDGAVLPRQPEEPGSRDCAGDGHLLARILCDEQGNLRIAEQRLPQPLLEAITQLGLGEAGCLYRAYVRQRDHAGRIDARAQRLHVVHPRHADLQQIAGAETELALCRSGAFSPEHVDAGGPGLRLRLRLRLRHGGLSGRLRR